MNITTNIKKKYSRVIFLNNSIIIIMKRVQLIRLLKIILIKHSHTQRNNKVQNMCHKWIAIVILVGSTPSQEIN